MPERRTLIAVCAVAALGLGAIAALQATKPGDAPESTVADSPAPSWPAATPQPSPQATPTVPLLRPFPADVVMVVASTGYGHGHGGVWELARYHLDARGLTQKTVLLKPPDSEGANITGVVASESGLLFASTCLGKLCPYEDGDKTGVETVFTRSSDGGITWKGIDRREGEWWVRAAVGERAIAVRRDSADPARQYAIFPGGAIVEGPPNAPNAEPVRFNREVGWLQPDGDAVLDSLGKILIQFDLGTPAQKATITEVMDSDTPYNANPPVAPVAVAWHEQTGDRARNFVGIFSPSGGAPVIKAEVGAAALGGWLNQRDLVFSAHYVRPGTCTIGGLTVGADPAVLERDSGAMSYIGSPFYDPACSHGGQLVVSVKPLTIWSRAKGDGECVNLRASPSTGARIIDCLGDGALVNTGKARESDGQRIWQSAIGPAGQAGWIAAEFLE